MRKDIDDDTQGYLSDHRADLTKLLMESYDKGVSDAMEAVLMTIEHLYNSEDPTPMYQTAYNHALSHIEEFIKFRKSGKTV
jgi:hypothetical protein